MSRGHCILSHGFESGPEATKVTALAEVAERLGWTHERPDYTDLDAMSEISRVGDVRTRLQRLVERAAAAAAQGRWCWPAPAGAPTSLPSPRCRCRWPACS